jgi:hypothetical protein
VVSQACRAERRLIGVPSQVKHLVPAALENGNLDALLPVSAWRSDVLQRPLPGLLHPAGNFPA